MKPEDQLIHELLKQEKLKGESLSLPEDLITAKEHTSTRWRYTLPILLSSAAAVGIAAYVALPKNQSETIIAYNERASVSESLNVQEERLSKGSMKSRHPARPSASNPRVEATATVSDVAIPVPNESITTPSLVFGDGEDFSLGVDESDAFAIDETNQRSFSAKPAVPSSPPLARKRSRQVDKGLTGRQDQLGIIDSEWTLSHPGGNKHGTLTDPAWQNPSESPLSTFSVDVDTASYTNLRRAIQDGQAIHPDAVRIEEMVNYFSYDYPQPKGDAAFAFDTQLTRCPWQENHLLARIAIQGKEVSTENRPAANLVFLLDVSGSMNDSRKLPLLQRSMILLLEELDQRDSVAVVVYAGRDAILLEPTKLNAAGLTKAIRTIENLHSGGSTNGGAGIQRAYALAEKHFVKGGVNRVILATDGDFNVGTTSDAALVDLVKEKAAKGTYLTVLGLGTGNLNDRMLEAISNDGNGNYYYIDSDREARNVFSKRLTGTLVTIAKDVKLQIEFNPGKVQAYRLLGYANRQLKAEDFNNDKVDAGDIGAGHTVTAFYEIVPVGVTSPVRPSVDPLKYQKTGSQPKPTTQSEDWFTLKLRHKAPDGDVSRLTEKAVSGEAVSFAEAGQDFRFASGVLMTGLKLRKSAGAETINWERIQGVAGQSADGDAAKLEFIGLLKTLSQMNK